MQEESERPSSLRTVKAEVLKVRDKGVREEPGKWSSIPLPAADRWGKGIGK